MRNTLRDRLTRAARDYASLYGDSILTPAKIGGRFIDSEKVVVLAPPSAEALNTIDRVRAELRSLLREIPLPEGYKVSLDMKAVDTGALTLMVRDDQNRFMGEIYIKTNGGIKFEEPRCRALDEMAIMEAIDGAPKVFQ